MSYNKTKRKNTNVVDALHQIAEQVHRRSLVIIFSDMMDNANNHTEVFNALKHLKHNKHEVVLFDVTDKKHEIDFEFNNRPYTFVDMETGEQVKLNPNQVKETFNKLKSSQQNELKLKVRSVPYRLC